MAVQFAVLASGSRGNAALVRSKRSPGLLIDVGLGPREMERRLTSVGASWSDIQAVVLTHTHTDHVDSGSFSELARRGVAVYCHERHRSDLTGDPGFHRLEAAGLVACYDQEPFLTPTGQRLEPIRLRHDGGPTFGFRIEVPTERRGKPVRIGYLADTGCWSEPMVDCLADVDVLGVEFNHDVDLQESSGRPRLLIERNLGDQGHLSNRQGADLVAAVLARSRKGTLRHVVLLHLSQQCNRPQLALDAARSVLAAAGRRAAVHAAKQTPSHPNLWIAARRSAVPAGGLERRGSGPDAASTTQIHRPGTPCQTALIFGELDDDSPTEETLSP
jgi:phosphoribosyl 1,2-cyclic phosphodiesterase